MHARRRDAEPKLARARDDRKGRYAYMCMRVYVFVHRSIDRGLTREKMLRPWFQQARQLTLRMGNSRASIESGMVCSHIQWACRGAPDPSAPRAASDFDPTSHADFSAATHPGVGGGTHRRRATVERC